VITSYDSRLLVLVVRTFVYSAAINILITRGDVQRNSELMENRCFVAVSRPRPALYLDYIKGTGTWHVQVDSITYQRPSEDNDDDDDNVDIANKQLRNLR